MDGSAAGGNWSSYNAADSAVAPAWAGSPVPWVPALADIPAPFPHACADAPADGIGIPDALSAALV